MWGTFFLSLIAGLIFLYLPGFLAIHAFLRSKVASLALAPLFSITAYVVACISYEIIDVSCSWLVVFLPAFLVGAILFAASRVLKKSDGKRAHRAAFAKRPGHDQFSWKRLALYVGIGAAMTFFVFVKNLDGADSFVQEYDNVYHLNTLSAFLQSGVWSCFGSTPYLSAADPANPLTTTGGFYPAAWHTAAAMISSCLGAPVTVASNALNTLLAAFVFPSSMYLLLAKIFRNDQKTVLAGAFVTMAFASFPWKIMHWGPIFPNFMALCFTPLIIFLFISITSKDATRLERGVHAALFIVGLLALAFTQPNAVFTAGTFLIPYCVWRVYSEADNRFGSRKNGPRWAIVIAAGLSVAFLALWVVCYHLPPLQTVIMHPWTPFTNTAQAVANVLFLSFRSTSAQLLLGALVVVGVVQTIVNRRHFWMTASYAIMAVIYIACAVTESPIRNFFSGFWYTDPMRIAANMALFAIPLAALGLSSAGSFACEKAHEALSRHQTAPFSKGPLFYAVSLLALVVICAPKFSIAGYLNADTAFGCERNEIEAAYRVTENNVYGAEEREFVQDALEIIPEDSLVINEPNDGSAFAFSVDGLNAYYRNMNGYIGTNETDESIAIRYHLDDIAEDNAVKAAVETTGATYLIQLDQNDDDRKSRYLFSYVEDDWRGIDAVNDETPGFEIVLSEGDMRLYRITAVS